MHLTYSSIEPVCSLLGNWRGSLLSLHVAVPVPPSPHEALVVGPGAPLVAAGEVKTDAAAGEALRAVLGGTMLK